MCLKCVSQRMKSGAPCARARHRNGNSENGNENGNKEVSGLVEGGSEAWGGERRRMRWPRGDSARSCQPPPPPGWPPGLRWGWGAGGYLRQAFTLHMRLDPLQPVRVLLLPHPFVHLRAQLFRFLQGVLQVAVVRMVFGGVFQDLRRTQTAASGGAGGPSRGRARHPPFRMGAHLGSCRSERPPAAKTGARQPPSCWQSPRAGRRGGECHII